MAAFIPNGTKIADIGSDHAYLPCYCVKHGIAREAVAGEVADGPYRSARRQVEQLGLAGKISVRKGDGLDVLSPGEAECITIAGMGGALIASILERGKEKLTGTKRLILQPNVGSLFVRKWCVENGWVIIGERILEEDGKIYEILAADAEARPQNLTEAELMMGPILIKENNAAFRKKWQSEKRKWQHILRKMSEAEPSPELEEKKSHYRHLIALAEEVLK